MNKDYVHEISRLLQSITDLTGISVVWKNSSGMADENLPEYQSFHCTYFCKKIKSRKGLIKKCSYNDCVIVMRRCEEIRVPFLNKCHAGVTELIVPILLNNTLDGAIFFGPFIDDTSKCVHRFAKNEYVQLKHFDQKLADAVKNIFSALVVFILESKEKIIRKQIAEKAGNKKIQSSLEYINANFKKPISASDAARESCLSVSRFIHLIKEECGIGFSEYLTARRIEEAKQMLVETDMKIFNIASYCGYAGQSYFGLVFKKATGMSPAGYRRKFKRDAEP